MSDMHTEYPKPHLPLSCQPTQPANVDDPSWSRPKPKFGQPTAIPPHNEPPLCALTSFGVTIVTPRPSEFSASDVKLALGTLNIEQVKHAIVEDCQYPTSLEKNTSGHLKVSYSFTGVETPGFTIHMKGSKQKQPHSEQEDDSSETKTK
jgi:hypothetical protein